MTANAGDEEKYHRLGRDYVICNWDIELAPLNSLLLKDRAILHDSTQEACAQWRSQNKESIFEPRVERAFEFAPEALVSWRCHALESFSQVSDLSPGALLFIHAMKADCTGEIPTVNPKLKLHSWLDGHYDTLILFGALYLFQRFFQINLDPGTELHLYRFIP